MIEIKNVSIETRHNILKDVNYIFEDGKIYGIVAINGSGKTTFFRTLVKLLHQSSGQIKFDMKSVDELRKNVFYYESQEWLDKNLSGMDYLHFVSSMWPSDKRIDSIVEYWSMEEYVKLPIKKYSLGMKQRLGIACALMECPDLILLDEPINAIDEKGVPKIWEALQEEKQRGALIMLACHDTEELTSLADRIITIEEGKICSISSQIERNS